MSRRGGGRDGKDRVVIYWERDLYLRCDRSSGHRTKMGKRPEGVCDSISIHEAKGERDKTSQAGRDQIGSCVSFRAAGSRVRILVSPLTFFFCIAGAYPVWHARDPQPVQFFRAVELPSMKKRLGERRLVRSGNLATLLT